MSKPQLQSFLVIFIIVFQTCCAQELTKDEAIDLAMKNGLEKGLDGPEIKLINERTWEISSLTCEDEYNSSYDIIRIDKYTKEIEHTIMVKLAGFPGLQSERTQINLSVDLDSIPLKPLIGKSYKLTGQDTGNERHPSISPDNEWIAFEYGNKEIGIINKSTRDFRPLCEDCTFPRWISNDWVLFSRNHNALCRINIYTKRQITILPPNILSGGGEVSPDFNWIAYTSEEVWNTPEKDSLGREIIHIFTEGQGQELCLLSTDGKIKRHLTKSGRYVHSPGWSANGDSLFFYIDFDKYFISNPAKHPENYKRLNHLQNVSLSDYRKAVKGIFPYKFSCEVFAVNLTTLEPVFKLINTPGRYDDLTFSNDLKYMVYSSKECHDCDSKLWILNLE